MPVVQRAYSRDIPCRGHLKGDATELGQPIAWFAGLLGPNAALGAGERRWSVPRCYDDPVGAGPLSRRCALTVSVRVAAVASARQTTCTTRARALLYAAGDLSPTRPATLDHVPHPQRGSPTAAGSTIVTLGGKWRSVLVFCGGQLTPMTRVLRRNSQLLTAASRRRLSPWSQGPSRRDAFGHPTDAEPIHLGSRLASWSIGP